jgi:hypothetical protein
MGNGLFVFARSFHEPVATFGRDIAAISAYLQEPVVGIEAAERHVDEETSDDVRAWKVVARLGEWVKVPLVVTRSPGGTFVVDPEHEEIEVLAARWDSYPAWFRQAMGAKHPRLRGL